MINVTMGFPTCPNSQAAYNALILLKSTPTNLDLDAPQAVERLIRDAEAVGASDVHLQMNGGTAKVSLRLDGLLAPMSAFEEPLAERVLGRIKYLARLKTYQESLPQEGRINKEEVGARHDIRVATYPTVTGEKLVLRLFSDCGARSFQELGLSADIVDELRRFLAGTSGLLLLTGPAGSGKTSTIYACLAELVEQGGRHIITIEDPVEQVIPGVMQTEVNEARGLTFAVAARHLLRQDPQVLVLGEIRDDETANLAVRAGLTGHLVISTLHAGSCKGVFERLLVMCRDHYAVWSATRLVLNQRLARRLCSACQGHGCGDCLQAGYRGRVPIVELLRVTDPLRAAVKSGGLDGIRPGTALDEVAGRLISSGITNQTEIGRILGI
jgi:type II secretory ATPase GspE/PulE/Tfp pilus assembly ATPase PilB-like protein